MMPASSNSFTVRYTVEIEILSSNATQRRYSSSTSGWSSASASTRAITRRCSVIREALKGWYGSATAGSLRQVAAHQKRVQLFPARLLVVALTAPHHREP